MRDVLLFALGWFVAGSIAGFLAGGGFLRSLVTGFVLANAGVIILTFLIVLEMALTKKKGGRA